MGEPKDNTALDLERNNALPPPPLSTPTTTQNFGNHKDEAAVVESEGKESALARANDTGNKMGEPKDNTALDLERNNALPPPPLSTPTTTQYLDWNNVEVQALFLQHMQNPPGRPLYNPPKSSVMPDTPVEDILARGSTQNPQLMHNFVQYMQSLHANEAPVPITANKRKNDEEGNSTNATVTKRKKTHNKPKKTP